MSEQKGDRGQRLVTAGLSAVGASAGGAGLAYAGHKLHQAYREAPKKLGVKGRLVRAASKEKFGTALLPLEAAGLGGEIMATKILHGDTKKQKPEAAMASKSFEVQSGSARGRRLVEPPKAEVEKGIGVAPSKRLAALAKQGKHVDGDGVHSDFARMQNHAKSRKARDEGAMKPDAKPFEKARRADPEADRQRRLGAYAGLATGGAIVTGDRAARHMSVSHPEGKAKNAAGRLVKVRGTHVGFKPGRGKVGAALTAGTAGLAGLAAAAYGRGVSERNQTWS